MNVSGKETVLRVLNRENVTVPVLSTPWCMKYELYKHCTGKDNIFSDAPKTVVDTMLALGVNFCPQFIMPSPQSEHRAIDPFQAEEVFDTHTIAPVPKPRKVFTSPEDVRDYIDSLPAPEVLAQKFDITAVAKRYAEKIQKLDILAGGKILFIDSFGQAGFMGPLTAWGYDNYLSAMLMYTEHIKKYYEYTAESGRLKNLAIVEAVKTYNLAPYVYGGQDICYNSGPLCSTELLDEIYFPALAKAVEPLHSAGIKIIWHCDGDIRKIVPQLVNKIRVSGFQGFQEETGCTLEIIASQKMMDGKPPIIMGSISVTDTLPYGTVDTVKKSVERCFEVTKRNGNPFILAPTSSILPETPLENILVMYETGKVYAKNPV
ncbi:MAG: uroporphyrinogen decarboxylase family protein [Elusimicrobiota bacterium]